jgi:hypothetical protein
MAPESQDSEKTKTDWWEKLKSLSGFISAVSAFGEDKLNLFSFLSPDVRNWQVAAVAAVLMGFAANEAAKKVRRLLPGWIFLVIAVFFLVLLSILGRRNLTASDATVTIAQVAYILLFGFSAATLGWFLGSGGSELEHKSK